MALPSDAVFNTRVDNLPVDGNSSSWAGYVSTVGVWFDYQWGTNVVDNSLASVPQTFYYTNHYKRHTVSDSNG